LAWRAFNRSKAGQRISRGCFEQETLDRARCQHRATDAELLLSKMGKTKNNAEFLASMAAGK
jgi:transcription termination factor Rho